MEIAAIEQLTPKGVLVELRECDQVEREIGARRLWLATVWADQHPAIQELPFTAPIKESLLDDGPIGVAAAAVAEFAAVLGVSTDSGARLLGDALELRNRLPRTWALVQEHRMLAWKARLLAQRTLRLSPEAVAWVDAQACLLGDRLGYRQTRQLVLIAQARFDPDGVPDLGLRRWATIRADQDRLDGAGYVDARLDLPDAVDLEAAIAAGAAELAAWGSTADLDTRRAHALGNLARTRLDQPALPTPDDPAAPDPGFHGPNQPNRPSSPSRARSVLLYFHLSQDALTSGDTGCLGEVGTTGQLVTVDDIRRWCGTAGTITVRPVIDLTTDHRIRGYQPTDRIREQLALRDRTCVFPWCNRPARPIPRQSGDYSFDADHIIPWDSGGETSTDNLACLCRKHHRLKTHTSWRYRTIGPAEYLWTSPNGYQFLRTTSGTTGLPPPAG